MGTSSFSRTSLWSPKIRWSRPVVVDQWHNALLMHRGRDKLQKDLESRFLFPLGNYAPLNWYCKACAVCGATKHPDW